MIVSFKTTKEWGIPQYLFDEWNSEFGFQLDVCASAKNAKCPSCYTEEQDGLTKDWSAVNWCHPPVGRDIPKWVRRAVEEAAKGRLTVMLLPARTDTRWFHEYCMKHTVRFLPGRIKFEGADHVAPFAYMLVIFNKKGKV